MNRILIVEDDPLSRELLSDWLEGRDFHIQAVDNLSAGLRAVQSQKPDLVLLDVNLGSEDGLELAAWMRRQEGFSSIPVIAVTAHAMVTERERIMQSGCSAFVPKPVDFRVLEDCLRQWLPK